MVRWYAPNVHPPTLIQVVWLCICSGMHQMGTHQCFRSICGYSHKLHDYALLVHAYCSHTLVRGYAHKLYDCTYAWHSGMQPMCIHQCCSGIYGYSPMLQEYASWMIVLMYGAVVCTKCAPTNVTEVCVDIQPGCRSMHSVWGCMLIVHARWLEGMNTSCMIVHMQWYAPNGHPPMFQKYMWIFTQTAWLCTLGACILFTHVG